MNRNKMSCMFSFPAKMTDAMAVSPCPGVAWPPCIVDGCTHITTVMCDSCMGALCSTDARCCDEEGCSVTECPGVECALIARCSAVGCNFEGCVNHLEFCIDCEEPICSIHTQFCADCNEALHYACDVENLCSVCFDLKSEFSEAEESAGEGDDGPRGGIECEPS